MEEQEEQETEFRFPLTTPISYHHNGQPTDAEFIVLHEPKTNNRNECAKLKQSFFRSLPTDGEKKKGETAEVDTTNPTGSEVMSLLAMSTDVELDEVLNIAKRLFCSGVAMIDGEEKLTGPVIDKMKYEDFEGMVGEYIVFFIVRSAMGNLTKI